MIDDYSCIVDVAVVIESFAISNERSGFTFQEAELFGFDSLE